MSPRVFWGAGRNQEQVITHMWLGQGHRPSPWLSTAAYACRAAAGQILELPLRGPDWCRPAGPRLLLQWAQCPDRSPLVSPAMGRMLAGCPQTSAPMPGARVGVCSRFPPCPWCLHRCKITRAGDAPEGVPQPLSPPSPPTGLNGWPGTDPRHVVAKPAGGIARAGAALALGRAWPPPWARAGCWPGSGTTVPRRW